MLATNSTIYWVLEKSKETILEFDKGAVKVYQIILVTYKKWLNIVKQIAS